VLPQSLLICYLSLIQDKWL